MIQKSDTENIRFVLCTLGVLLVVSIICAIFALGPIPLVVTVAALYLSFVIYGWRANQPVVWLWLLIGLVTGTVEVVSNCDSFLVLEQQVLIYPDTFPKIGVSPAYLPLAWGLVFTQLGLIGDFLRKWKSLLAATLLTAGFAGVMISVFENLARPALWWYYQNTPMFMHTPFFVNAFEFLSTVVFVPVGWAIAKSAKKDPTWLATIGWAVAGGVFLGIWMCVAMRFSYWLLGPCEGAVIQFAC